MYESFFEKILREQREREERRKNLLGALLSQNKYSQPLSNPLSTLLTTGLIPKEKRKIFISFHHGDENEVKSFVERWAEKEKVFIPKALGVSNDDDDFIDSDNPEYVMSQIRKKYLQDSTVTIILIGSCTHSRRYVDWEIKTSLRQGLLYTPNGLIGILLPYQGTLAHFPPRLIANWNSNHINCYARCYTAPTSATQLRNWIEDAFNARIGRAKHINNTVDMMKYNSVCEICHVTH